MLLKCKLVATKQTSEEPVEGPSKLLASFDIDNKKKATKQFHWGPDYEKKKLRDVENVKIACKLDSGL